MAKQFFGAAFFSAIALAASPVIAQAVPVTSQAKTVYQPTGAVPSPDAVESLGQAWGRALASRDPAKITALYDADAVLLATFTNELDTPTELRDYFTGLTKREGLQVKFNEQNIRLLNAETATNSGLYTFSFIENGKTVEVPARYTFVYAKRGNTWMIVEHHSSIRPEQPKTTQK